MKTFTFILLIFSVSILWGQEGLVKSYYPNDTLKSEINFERSIRNGAAKFYYENGNIKEEVTYLNGKIDGLVKEYNENGKLRELYTVENGKRQGQSSFYDSTGKWIADKDFDSGIRVIEQMPEEETDSVQQTEVASTKEENKNVAEANDKINNPEEKSLPPTVKEENFDSDPSYYTTVEVMPQPEGGIAELQKKLIYPAYAKENEIQGTVEVKAFIDQNGDVSKAEVTKGIGYGCDDVAKITVLYTKFTPGLIRGKPVRTQIIIPLEFKLSDKE